MKAAFRYTMMVILAMAAAFTVIYMQHKFDEGDRKGALRIVDEYRAPSTKQSLGDVLKKLHPKGSIVFSATTESSCFQHVRVTAMVQDFDAQNHPVASRYDFLVDINTRHIAPGNDLGKEAIAELDRPASFDVASSSASSPGTPAPSAPSPSSSSPAPSASPPPGPSSAPSAPSTASASASHS